MSLKVWLPLNGNLNNYGLSNVTITNDGATVNPNGKIGSCYCPATVTLTNLNGLTFTNCSFCFWAKTSNTTKIWQSIIRIDDMNLSKIHGIYFVANDARVKLEYHPSINIATPSISEWHHYAFTIQNGESKGYLDGQLIQTSTESVTSDIIGRLKIGDETAISLNDVRIYDHCLSPKEIHDIAQGLVLHYLMNDHAIAMSKCSNVVWNQEIEAGIYYDASIKRTLTTKTINGVTFTAQSDGSILVDGTAEGGNAALLLRYGVPFVANRKCFIRGCPAGGSLSTYFLYDMSIGTWIGDTGSGWIFTSRNESYLSIRIQEGYTADNLVFRPQFFDLTRMFGAGNEPATVKEFENMFPNPYYPYYPNESGIVTDLSEPLPDCSGYRNDGEISGELDVVFSGSPRYDKCTQFNGETYTVTTLSIPEIKTTSFWLYVDTTLVNSDTILFMHRQSGLAFGIYKTGGYITVSSNGLKYTKTYPISSLVVNSWNHIVLSYTTSNNINFYVNGELKTITTSEDYWGSEENNILSIGRRIDTSRQPLPFTGKISDFRMYTTVLSESDIQDLYALGAQITE